MKRSESFTLKINFNSLYTSEVLFKTFLDYIEDKDKKLKTEFLYKYKEVEKSQTKNGKSNLEEFIFQNDHFFREEKNGNLDSFRKENLQLESLRETFEKIEKEISSETFPLFLRSNSFMENAPALTKEKGLMVLEETSSSDDEILDKKRKLSIEIDFNENFAIMSNSNSPTSVKDTITTLSDEMSNDDLKTLDEEKMIEYTIEHVLLKEIEIFLKFSEKEFSSENVLFWKELTKFKKEKDEKMRKEIFVNTFKRFLDPESPTALNLNERNAKKIKKLFSDGDMKNFFEHLENNIKGNMIDIYRRFITSDMWLEHVNKEYHEEKEKERREILERDKQNRLLIEKLLVMEKNNVNSLSKRSSFIHSKI
jgi:hypothetical protein